jgi:hypothetical protein
MSVTILREDRPPITEEPNQQLIGYLETALAAAKSGEMRAMCLVGLLTNDRNLMTWASFPKDRVRLIGSMTLAMAKLVQLESGPIGDGGIPHDESA